LRNGRLEVDRDEVLGRSPLGPVGHTQCRLAARLFVHLLFAYPTTAEVFPAAQLIAYDIVDLDIAAGVTRWTLGDLAGTVPLTTAGLDLPTVVFQQPDAPLRALYGSCRKFHGPGDDALACAARHLFEGAHAPARRPTALFLIGDQIYADDVPDAVVPALQHLGRYLTEGVDETVPGVTLVPPGGAAALPVRDFPETGQRQEMLQRNGFTSTHAGNHLMRFSEFAAAYLMAWSAEHWFPEDLTGSPEAREVAKYFKALPAIRRLLANVPTYMMFDDHEITDDWYRTPAWRSRVVGGPSRFRGNPTTRRVIANGLAAYWAFQGWGNDPSGTASLADPIAGHLYRPGVEAKDRDPSVAQRFERAVLDFGGAKAGWSFTAPTAPTTLFVDCRTRRGARTSTFVKRSVGALVDDNVWDHLRALSEGPDAAGSARILVLGTPFYNVALMEQGQAVFSQWPGGGDTWDDETWAGYSLSQRELLDFCCDLQVDSVMILSGDVHYASAARGRVLRGETDSVLIRQFTSSSLKNDPGFVPRAAALKSRANFERRHPPRKGLGWILEKVDFETEFASPDLELGGGLVIRGVKCVTDTNVGLFTHYRSRVENTLLVPRSTSQPDDPEEGLAYAQALTTNW